MRTRIFYVILLVQLWSFASEVNYFPFWIDIFWVVMVGSRKNSNIFVSFTLIIGSHCPTFTRLLNILRNIIWSYRDCSLYFLLCAFLTFSKTKSCGTKSFGFSNIIISCSWEGSYLTIWFWSLRLSKKALGFIKSLFIL